MTAAETAADTGPAGALLELNGVSKRFTRRLDAAAKIARLLGARLREETVHAVDDVSLAIAEGEVVGLVGESGCGKSTLGRVVAGIHQASAGTVRYRGRDVAALEGRDRMATALAIQMIFQDPMSSLNPRLRVAEIIGEAVRVHRLVPPGELDDYVADLMRRVGLDPDYRKRYPHQFSGGQRQRIGIARALAVRPEFLVCDEAVAALDVSIQAQVLNLFMDLRQDFNLTYLFISHDLSMVRHFADRVAVMYLGKVAELANVDTLFGEPKHPYTRALLSAVPVPDPKIEATREHIILKGDVPSPANPPKGCRFCTRCPDAIEKCFETEPIWRRLGDGRDIACHIAGD